MINKKYFFVLFVLCLFILPSLRADLTTDLIAYYKLDETSGTTVTDSTGTNNATNYNVTVNQTGKIDKAYDFNGNLAYLQSGAQSFTGNSNYTISAWIKTDVADTYQVIFSNGIESPEAGLKFKINSNNTIGVDLANVVGTTSTSTVSTGTWYFVTLTKSENTYQIYINGSADGSAGTITSSNISAIGTQRIGRDVSSGTDYFNGLLDEVGVWSRALTSQEVSDLYNSGDGISYPFYSVFPSSFGGNYFSDFNLTLTTDQPSSTGIFYTTDGTDPDNTDTKYTTPILIDENVTIKAVSYNGSYYTPIMSETYYKIPPYLRIQFYDENSLATLDDSVYVTINENDYYADATGYWDYDLDTVGLSGDVSATVNATGYAQRNLDFYWGLNGYYWNFGLLPEDSGLDIDFLAQDENNNLWTNKYVQFVNDGNIISSNKTSSTGYFTSYNLSDGDYNAVLYDATGTQVSTYQKTTVTIKIPKDEITLSVVSPYDIDVGGLLTYSLSNQSTASTFNIFAGTVDTYSVQVVDYDSVPADREYLPRNYTFKVPFGTSYTSAYSLQPYLLKEIDGVTPTIFVLDKIKRPVEGVIIDIYKNMGGIKTLVESVETTSVGRTSFSAYPLATYTLKMYYQNSLKGTYTIQPRSSDDRFYFVLDLIDTGVQPVSVDFSADWANTSESFNLTTTDPAVDVDLNIGSYNSSPVLSSYTLLAYQNEVLIGTINDVLSGTTDNITDSFNKVLFSSRDGLITFILTVNYSVSGVSYSNTSYFAAGVTENNNSTISLLKALPDDIGKMWAIILAILITISVLVLVTTTGLVQNQQAITITGILILGVFVFLGWLDTGVSILGTDIGRFVYVVSAIFGMFLMVKEGNK